LQINYPGFLCTLGFAAVRQGITGFVTNSHCTNTQGGVEGTIYNQPIFDFINNQVGVEIADPPYFTGGSCPAGKRCRFSDSAFVRAAITTALGSIARPPDGSFTWNGTHTFTITAEADPLMGQSVIKVGRTTGRTSGTVQKTCALINVTDTDITLLCQSQATYLSVGGDSGSPVFRLTVLPNVTLVGINWSTGGHFSPITGIQRIGELGSINTCAVGSC
jgi:hypothetical protein